MGLLTGVSPVFFGDLSRDDGPCVPSASARIAFVKPTPPFLWSIAAAAPQARRACATREKPCSGERCSRQFPGSRKNFCSRQAPALLLQTVSDERTGKRRRTFNRLQPATAPERFHGPAAATALLCSGAVQRSSLHQ